VVAGWGGGSVRWCHRRDRDMLKLWIVVYYGADVGWYVWV